MTQVPSTKYVEGGADLGAQFRLLPEINLISPFSHFNFAHDLYYISVHNAVIPSCTLGGEEVTQQPIRRQNYVREQGHFAASPSPPIGEVTAVSLPPAPASPPGPRVCRLYYISPSLRSE